VASTRYELTINSMLIMEKMNIDINLSGQEENKFRTVYLVLGTTGLVYITLSLVLPELGLDHYYYLWIVFLPGIIESLL
jgi:hypothetical protein